MNDQTSNAIDVKAFRQALGKFATGVTVITTRQKDGTPRGFTANSFTSVSLDPPLVLVCIARSAASCDEFCEADHFSVNVLGDNQKETSNLFASQRADKFEVAEWHQSNSGTPLIDDALAWFDCARNNVVEAGDHIILIGQVTEFGSRDGQPLGYFSGNYFNLEVETKLVDALSSNASTVLGVIYEKNDTVLLRVDEQTGTVTIPGIGREGGKVQIQKLEETFGGAPLNGVIDFVYSVFEDKRSDTVTIYYRGHATGTAPEGYMFYSLDQIPWEKIQDNAIKIMLTRFGEEKSANQFAVYMGDEAEGIYRPVQ